MNFFGIGPGELILILIIALIVFGPRKLPEIGATLGKAIREFRQASQELTKEISQGLGAEELKEISQALEAEKPKEIRDDAGEST